MGLCKDFWPVLPFPTHSSSHQCVLERDHLAPCSCSCLCSGTRIQPCKWLLSPMNSLVCGQPEPHCSGEGNTGLELREPRLCWWLSQSHIADQCSSTAWHGGSYPLFACGEMTIAQSWLPEVPKSAALFSVLLHGELSSCISRRAGSESQHPSAASCCFILLILYHSLAMLHSTSNYKVKPSQKPWTEIEWKSQQEGIWGQLT